MKCPFCSSENTRVIDSRPADDNNSIRRRRLCDDCGKRFTTYEKVETIPLIVIKKDNCREQYDRSKIEAGVLRACHKRPVSVEQITRLVDEVETEIFNREEKEIPSTVIGEILMDKIKDFNYKNIYSCKRILPSRRYFNLVITEIYNLLKSTYAGSNTLDNLKNLSFTYPKLGNGFIDFIHNYYDFGNRDELKLKNKVLFSIDNEKDFCKAINYYISGMTDNFAIEIYNEIIHFQGFRVQCSKSLLNILYIKKRD